MKQEDKKVLKKIISILIITVLIYSSVTWLKSINSYKKKLDEMMNKDLRNFNWMLVDLNDDIANMLIYNDKEINKHNNFNSKTKEAVDLILSNLTVQKISIKRINFDDNYLNNVYWNVDKNIKKIIEDNYIDDKEESYLRTLYNYNIELLKLYSECSDEKKITDIYSRFNNEADEILNTEEFNSLKTFGFKNVDLNQAKKICENIFKKIISIDNKNQYIFKFKEQHDEYYEFEGDIVSKGSNKNNMLADINYEISYNIEDDSIYIIPKYSSEKYDNVINDTKINLSKEGIDKIAKKIVRNIYGEDMVDYDAELLSYTVDKIDKEKSKILEEEKFGGVSYKFIGMQGDIYDKRKEVDFEINEKGIIKSFNMSITDYSGKIIIPKINEEKILSKFDKDFIIKNSFLVINTDGKLEYKVLGEYNKSMYTVVFDAETGKQKDFYNEVIEYN
ncbi:hypothetical protein [Tepidibacter mesophilus]|uniref:hypothetical protein n=1 Tax=Tepidibacter mesophilus TaxID=655607 RepID=UPI000C06A73D|nr:hypothetical protein [Tepidibacter mesophilus]